MKYIILAAALNVAALCVQDHWPRYGVLAGWLAATAYYIVGGLLEKRP